jgi:hypothetical protein
MKDLGIYVVILCLMLPGCRFFESKIMYSSDVDTLIDYSKKLETIIQQDSVRYKQEIEKIITSSNHTIDSLKRNYAKPDSLQDNNLKFLIIAGSFKVKTNAINFSNEIKSLGYEGSVIMNPDNFYLVSIKSDSNLRKAEEHVYLYRQKLKIPVWIYVRE